MSDQFKYPKHYSYAVGDFVAKHKDLWFSGADTLLKSSFFNEKKIKVSHKDVEAVEFHLSTLHPNTKLFNHISCQYCNTKLNINDFDIKNNDNFHKSPIAESFFDSVIGRVFNCENCGWWQVVKNFETGFANDFDHQVNNTYFVHVGVLQSFETEKQDRCIEEIRRQIQKNDTHLHSISPQKLELLVGSVVREHFGCNVRHVGGPGDRGIDLIMSESINPIAIQVKRREKSNVTESVSLVRHMLGAMVLNKYKHGIIATTANKFSKVAMKTVEEIKRENSILIELYDKQKLIELIAPDPLSANPWEILLKPPPKLKIWKDRLKSFFE